MLNFLFGAKKTPKTIRQDKYGHETLDPTPMALPLDHEIPESIEDKIKRLIASERFQQSMEAQGYETFDEADDFDVGDDFEAEPNSQWELSADQESFRRSPPKKTKTQAKPENKPEALEEPKSTEKTPPSKQTT